MNRGPANVDPNATLARLRELMLECLCEDLPDDYDWEAAATLQAEYFEALDGWILHGGFLPQDWQEAQTGKQA